MHLGGLCQRKVERSRALNLSKLGRSWKLEGLESRNFAEGVGGVMRGNIKGEYSNAPHNWCNKNGDSRFVAHCPAEQKSS